MPTADPPRSLLVGVAELLEDHADSVDSELGMYDDYGRKADAVAFVEHHRTAASSLRALEEVLATMPEPRDPSIAGYGLGEHRASCCQFVARLRTALTAPTTGENDDGR